MVKRIGSIEVIVMTTKLRIISSLTMHLQEFKFSKEFNFPKLKFTRSLRTAVAV